METLALALLTPPLMYLIIQLATFFKKEAELSETRKQIELEREKSNKRSQADVGALIGTVMEALSKLGGMGNPGGGDDD